MRQSGRSLLFVSLFSGFLVPPCPAAQLVVGAAEFHARKEEGHFFDSSGFVEGSLAEDGDGCLVAPVRLPYAALATRLTLQFYDDRTDGDFRIELRRKRRGNSVPAEIVAGGSTSGASGNFITLVVPIAGGHRVSDTFVYFLSTEADCTEGPDHRIYAVRIDYEAPVFSDDFESGDLSAWSAPPPTVFSSWTSGIEFQNGDLAPWTIATTLATFWFEYGFGGTAPCAWGPVELPHGAVVQGLLSNLYDVRGDRDLALTLRRAPMAGGGASSTLLATSTTGSAGWQLRSDLTADNGTIDNDTYWYWLDLCPVGGQTAQAAELGVQSVQVLYTTP